MLSTSTRPGRLFVSDRHWQAPAKVPRVRPRDRCCPQTATFQTWAVHARKSRCPRRYNSSTICRALRVRRTAILTAMTAATRTRMTVATRTRTVRTNTGTHTSIWTTQVSGVLRRLNGDAHGIPGADDVCDQADSLSGICPTIRCATSKKGASQSASAGTLLSSLKSTYSDSHSRFHSPVGSGKTALTLALCQKLRSQYNIGTSLRLPSAPNLAS